MRAHSVVVFLALAATTLLPQCKCSSEKKDTAALVAFHHDYLALLSERVADCRHAPKEAVTAMVKTRPLNLVNVAQAYNDDRLVFGAEQVEACLRYVKSAQCEEVEALAAADVTAADSPCLMAMGGRSQRGGVCYSGLECVSGTYCTANELKCPGGCRPTLVEDASCTEHERCAEGLACTCSDRNCIQRVCKRVSKQAALCGKSDMPPCGLALYCVPSGAPQAGTCRPQIQEGACPASEACLAPARCVGLDTVQRPGKCQMPKGVGEPCVPGAGECTDMTACKMRGGEQGECVSWAAIGASCGPLSDGREFIGCVAGYCDLSQNPERGVCKPYKANGESCDGAIFMNQECGAGRCDLIMHKCVYPCVQI